MNVLMTCVVRPLLVFIDQIRLLLKTVIVVLEVSLAVIAHPYFLLYIFIPYILSSEILTSIKYVLHLRAIGAEYITTDPAVMLPVEEGEVFPTLAALVHLVVRHLYSLSKMAQTYPCGFSESGILVIVHETFYYTRV